MFGHVVVPIKREITTKIAEDMNITHPLESSTQTLTLLLQNDMIQKLIIMPELLNQKKNLIVKKLLRNSKLSEPIGKTKG